MISMNLEELSDEELRTHLRTLQAQASKVRTIQARRAIEACPVKRGDVVEEYGEERIVRSIHATHGWVEAQTSPRTKAGRWSRATRTTTASGLRVIGHEELGDGQG